MSLTMVTGGAPFGSFGAVSLSWPTEASPVLPVPRALTGVGRAALRNGEKACQEIGSAPDCRPTVAHTPKVMTHRPEGRAGPRSCRSRAGRLLPLKQTVRHLLEPPLPLHVDVVGPVHHHLGRCDAPSLLRGPRLRRGPVGGRIRAWTPPRPSTRRPSTA